MKKANVTVSSKKLEGSMEKVLHSEVSKSEKMKQLFDLGLDVKTISNLLEVRYNFVYNVVSNYARVNEIVTESPKKEGKKEDIIRLHKEGKTLVQISQELKTNYNYIWKVVKEEGDK